MVNRKEIDPALSEENSAFQTHMGYRLTHWEEGYARLEQLIAPFLLNRMGIPHGGNYCTILDTAMGFSGVYTGDPERKGYALTLSLNVNFIAPAQGDLLVVEAEVSGGGKRTFFAHGRITDRQGRLIATGSGAFQRRESV
ncbi:PaaI family thioesterase [Cognatishimia activa]|uniref:PaaI family thioesterase n=1 Tax=Cognatishimia activa TaxID=1715691 RepID=UPI002230EE16|nr:PaaI family thioesterase [Cognatishimia activa]UZD91561.1 PaaI family thioesterase [Cognatishimia activa]